MNKDATLGFLVGFLFVTGFMWTLGMDFSQRGTNMAGWFLLSTFGGAICATGDVRLFWADVLKGQKTG
ncbi:hypothetical protein V6O07_06030 [Arthrospira platensis SPKY2]